MSSEIPEHFEELICPRCGDRSGVSGSEGELCRSCVERVTPESEPVPWLKDPVLSSFSLVGALFAGLLIAILLVMAVLRPATMNARALPTFLICVGQVVVSIATERRCRYVPVVWPIWLIVAVIALALTANSRAFAIRVVPAGIGLAIVALIRAIQEPRYHLCDPRRLGLPEA